MSTKLYVGQKGFGIPDGDCTPDAFFSMFTITPPFREQAQIADFLDRKTQQIDELISTEYQKIELLKEYRQSLISEVVTGKIDVRNEV